MQSSTTTAQLHVRRRQLLSQIEDLDQIRRGSITEQFVESVRQDGTKVRRGPYTLYSFKDKGGRTVSRRLSDPAQIAHYRSQIDAFRQSQQCTAELLALGETLCDRALEVPATEKKTPTTDTKIKKRSKG
jgi:transposase